MQFYVIMRRETSLYILGDDETSDLIKADRYYHKKLAIDAMGPNTCVCGPHIDDSCYSKMVGL